MLKKDSITFRVSEDFKEELKEKALKHKNRYVKISKFIRHILKENI